MKKVTIYIMILLVSCKISAQDAPPTDFHAYFISGQYDSARIALEQRLNKIPDNKPLYFYLGKTYLALKQPSHAIPILNEALENKASDTRILEMIGLAYEEQNMISEAIDAYQSAIRWDTHHPSVSLKLSALYLKQHRYDSSISVLRDFLSHDSTNTHAWYLLGRSYIKYTTFDSAVLVSSRAVAIDSTSFSNFINLGIANFNLDRFNDAINNLKSAIRLSPKSDEAKYYLGLSYYSLYQKTDAAHQLETCADLNGSYKVKALKTLTMVYYHIDSLQKCIDTANIFFSLNQGEYLGFVYHYLGRALSDQKKHTEANEAYHKALKLSGADFVGSTYFYQALNFYDQKSFPEAIKHYKKALTLDPNFHLALYNLAIAYDDYYQDKRTAITYYQKLIELSKYKMIDASLIETVQRRIDEITRQQFLKK